MTFSIILLGILIILTSFNVGESIWKKLGISKKTLLILLLATAVLYFIPNISINGITFTWVGFVLPVIFSTIIIIKTPKAINFFKMFVATLISFSLGIIYNLITFDVYESSIFQPYLVLALIVGSFPLILTNDPKRLYASNTVGFLFSEFVFYLSRYSVYGDYYLTLGSEKIFAILLLSFVFSENVHFIYRRVKIKILRRKLNKKERENLLA